MSLALEATWRMSGIASWRGHSCLPRPDFSGRLVFNTEPSLGTSAEAAGKSACATKKPAMLATLEWHSAAEWYSALAFQF